MRLRYLSHMQSFLKTCAYSYLEGLEMPSRWPEPSSKDLHPFFGCASSQGSDKIAQMLFA